MREDYTIAAKGFHRTGQLLDASNSSSSEETPVSIGELLTDSRNGDVLDITEHIVSVHEGIALAGQHARGQYVSDRGQQRTLGCIELPATEFSGMAMSAFATVWLQSESQNTSCCLLFMGDGWDSHFTIYIENGRPSFQVCPKGECAATTLFFGLCLGPFAFLFALLCWPIAHDIGLG